MKSEKKKTKRTVRFFSVVDWQEEQDYLRKQHKAGHKFVRYNGLNYVFEECEPEDVVYQLDFRAEDRDREEYLQMFKDCGWEYLQDFFGYSYFRKPVSQMRENEEGIFCDNESRLEMLKNVYRKKILPLVCIFFSVIVPQIVGQNLMARESGDLFPRLLSAMFAVLFVIYLVIFIRFGCILRRLKKSMGK